MYGTSKVRLATQVGEVPGTSGATCNAKAVHPGVLGSMVITENRGCRRVLQAWVGDRSQWIGDSFYKYCPH